MDIAGSTALVTGANRGLGREFARQLVERGATVYAGARDIASIDLPGVVPVRIDITDEASVRAAAELARDVTLLVNNAGVSTGASLLDGDLADVHREMDTHYFGTLAVVRAFAPQLTAHGGAVLNVLSALSWVSFPAAGAYSAAKSAEWSLTNALRQELAPSGVTVTALHVGYMDTDMARGVDAPEERPGRRRAARPRRRRGRCARGAGGRGQPAGAGGPGRRRRCALPPAPPALPRLTRESARSSPRVGTFVSASRHDRRANVRLGALGQCPNRSIRSPFGADSRSDGCWHPGGAVARLRIVQIETKASIGRTQGGARHGR